MLPQEILVILDVLHEAHSGAKELLEKRVTIIIIIAC